MKLTPKSLFSLFILLLVPATSFAGQEKGGGSGVACFETTEEATLVRQRKGKILDEELPRLVSLETTDLYEAKAAGSWAGGSSFVFDKRRSGESQDQWLKRQIFKIGVVFPDYGRHVGEVNKKYGLEGVVYADEPIAFTDDVGEVSRPVKDNCVLVTLAYRTNNRLTVVMDKRLYNHPLFSEASKLTLRLHEILYEAYIRFAFNRSGVWATSIPARRLAAHLINESTRQPALVNWFNHREFTEESSWIGWDPTKDLTAEYRACLDRGDGLEASECRDFRRLNFLIPKDLVKPRDVRLADMANYVLTLMLSTDERALAGEYHLLWLKRLSDEITAPNL